jgi:FSR family fosmidomycin resistance protein-like MFS transporter
MSYFNVGGNVGYALGAVVVTPLILWLGLPGAMLAAIPALAVALSVQRLMPYLAGLRPSPRQTAGRMGETRVGAMVLLGAVIALRSVAWFGLLTFVPLWVVSQGGTEGEGNRELSLMLVAGAGGTLLIGPLADRFGLRRTMVVTQAVLPLTMLVFLQVGGLAGTLALMCAGVCVVGTFSVSMVLSQLYLPRHVGLASGLSIGLAMGLGGVAALLLGGVADAIDLETALTVAAIAPAVGVVLCLMLPAPRRTLAVEGAAAAQA